MQLNATLTHLAAQRGALVAAAASPQFTALVDQLQVPSVRPMCTSLHEAGRVVPARAPSSLQSIISIEFNIQFSKALTST